MALSRLLDAVVDAWNLRPAGYRGALWGSTLSAAQRLEVGSGVWDGTAYGCSRSGVGSVRRNPGCGMWSVCVQDVDPHIDGRLIRSITGGPVDNVVVGENDLYADWQLRLLLCGDPSRGGHRDWAGGDRGSSWQRHRRRWSRLRLLWTVSAQPTQPERGPVRLGSGGRRQRLARARLVQRLQVEGSCSTDLRLR